MTDECSYGFHLRRLRLPATSHSLAPDDEFYFGSWYKVLMVDAAEDGWDIITCQDIIARTVQEDVA